MSKAFKFLLGWLWLLSFTFSTMAYATQFADEGEAMRLRWKTKIISIAFSTSLTKQNPYINPVSDVLGAVEKSLETWENAANIKFQVSWTDKQTISPSGKSGDGVSLITIAQTPENLLLFGSQTEEVSARTRIFFNRKGFITEADIVLNPYEQFSTDGSIGTFDLQATLTHEIGHLLGLEHSTITGATMHDYQAKNGVYNLSGFSPRTLGEDDSTGIRALYGPAASDEECCGTISGSLTLSNGKAAKDFQVWAEDAKSGRVIAGVTSNTSGNFRIEGLHGGQYKIYTQDSGKNSEKSYAVENIGEIEVAKGKTQNIFKKLKSSRKSFAVQYVGFNGQISDLAVPINGGRSYLIYVGGKNLNSDNLTIGFKSPYLSATPKTLINHDYGADISVVSFEVKVASEIPFGEYSFFLKNKDDESQFAVGSLTVEAVDNPWNSHQLLEGK
jgi:hypothetical protein